MSKDTATMVHGDEDEKYCDGGINQKRFSRMPSI